MSTTYTMVIDGETVRGELDIDEKDSTNANHEFMDLLNTDLKAKGFDIKFSAKRFNYKPTGNDAQDPSGAGYFQIMESTFIRETYPSTYELPPSVFNVTLTVEGGSPQVFNGVTITSLANLINTSLTLPFIATEFMDEYEVGEERVAAQVNLTTPAISKLVTIDVTVVSGSVTISTLNVDAAIYVNDSLSVPIYLPQSRPQTFGTDGPSAEYIPTQVFVSGNVGEIYIPLRKSNLGIGYRYDLPVDGKMDLNSQVRFPITINVGTRETVLGYNRNYILPDLDYKDPVSKTMVDYPVTDVFLDDQEGSRITHAIDNLNYDQVSTYDGRTPVKMFRFTVESPIWVKIDRIGGSGSGGAMLPWGIFNQYYINRDAIWVSEDESFDNPTSYTPGEANNDIIIENSGGGDNYQSYSRWMYPGFIYLFAASHVRPYGDISDSMFDIRTWANQQ